MPRPRKGTGERRREARLPLFAVLLLFAVAAAYTSFLTIQQDTTVNRLASYDDAFDAGQGAVAARRLGMLAMGAPCAPGKRKG